jgi:ADP-ribosyltransferase exoenzyme
MDDDVADDHLHKFPSSCFLYTDYNHDHASLIPGKPGNVPDSLTVHTFVVDLPRQFAPDMGGSTPDETAGWGWFKRKEVADLPLHPDFEEVWDSISWGQLGKLAVGEIVKVGPKGYVHGWIYVGPANVGSEVTHPEHGRGVVISAADGAAEVKYHDGEFRVYDARFDGSVKPHFETGHKPDEPLTGLPARSAVPGKYSLGRVQLTGKMTPERAVSFYSSSGYKRINKALRLNNGDLGRIQSEKNSQLGDYISAMDKAMDGSSLTHSVTVSRGADNGPAIFGTAWQSKSSMVGAAWVDDGFVSTSFNPDVAQDFATIWPSSIRMNITAPAGIHAITTSEDREVGEEELILDRGLKYTVTGDNIDSGNLRELEVTVSQP